MSELLDNPAGRLAAFLRSLPTRGENKTIGEVLSLASDDGEPFAVAVRMLEIRKLMRTTKETIENLPTVEDPPLLLKHFGEVERAINGMTESALHSAGRLSPTDAFSPQFPARRIRDEVLYSLDICSRVLHRRSPEPAVDEAQLKELLVDVRALIDAVISAESLNSDAKTFLVQRLRDVETALLGSQISGFANLEDALDRLMGGLVRRSDVQDRGVLARVGSFFQKLVIMAQGTTAITGATSSTIQALEAIVRYRSSN